MVSAGFIFVNYLIFFVSLWAGAGRFIEDYARHGLMNPFRNKSARKNFKICLQLI